MKKTLNLALIILVALLYVGGSVDVTLARDFTDNGDGTVTDNEHEITWMQTPSSVKNHPTAEQACLASEFAGYDDWRLPNVAELTSLLDRTRIEPSTFVDFFDVDSRHEWTVRRDFANQMNNEWVVDLYFGRTRTTNK